MPQSGIYAITNVITNDCYVGSSARLAHRRQQHFNALRRGCHACQHLQRSFDKYGESSFVFSVLEETLPEKDVLIQREQHWMDTLQPRFNKRVVAHSNLGMKNSEETRLKKSEAAKKRPPHSPEVIARIAAKRRGSKRSEAAKRKTSETLKANKRVWTEEQKQQIAESNRDAWAKKSKEEKHSYTQNRPPISEETRTKQRKAKLGRKLSRESVEKRSATVRGSKRSEEARQHMREAQQALAEQRRLANPQEPKVYKYSEERRQKMAEGRKATWARKKAAQAESQIIKQEPLF